MSPLFRREKKENLRVRRASIAHFETEPAAAPPRASNPLASWGGRVLVARDMQNWPMGEGGPMLAVAQLNLTEAPYVPDVIAEFQMLTLFVGPFRLPNAAEPDAHWSLRAYRDLDLLAPLPEPIPARSGDGDARVQPTLRALPISWTVVDEQPPEDESWGEEAAEEPEPETTAEEEPPAPLLAGLDDDDDGYRFATGEATAHAERMAAAAAAAADELAGADPDAGGSIAPIEASGESDGSGEAGDAISVAGTGEDEDPELVADNDGTKIGGFPKLVAGPIAWPADDVTFVMQIDGRNPLGLGLGPSGMLYVGYRPADASWHVVHGRSA